MHVRKKSSINRKGKSPKMAMHQKKTFVFKAHSENTNLLSIICKESCKGDNAIGN
jgi:hypothetical protein